MANTSIQILLTIVAILFLSVFVALIVTMTVNYKSYKYYRVTYYAIKTCSYVMVRNSFNQQTYHRPQETDPYTNDEIIFFLNRNGDVDSIKLISRRSENHYIHDKGGWDLYARYWFKKILKVRDKYNHELNLVRLANQLTEDYLENNYHVTPQRRQFKFLRG